MNRNHHHGTVSHGKVLGQGWVVKSGNAAMAVDRPPPARIVALT